MQYAHCNICNTDDIRLITVLNGYNVVKCKNCGLVYVNPRPDSKMLIELYAEYHQRGGKDADVWARLMEGNFKESALLLNKIMPEKGKILDIGCGYGHFMRRMRDFGWSVYGIDPSLKVLGYARNKGLNVFEKSIEDVSFPDNYFDAVTAFYVLEHLADPFTTLKKIFQMMKPQGVLILRVPHTTPIVQFLSFFKLNVNLYDVPYHLYDFSPKTISLLLKKSGFSTVRVIPGSPTIPANYFERVISVVSGNIARFLFTISAKKFLLPGTSKTVLAFK